MLLALTALIPEESAGFQYPAYGSQNNWMDKFDSEPQYQCEQFKSCHASSTASFVAAAFPTHHRKQTNLKASSSAHYYPGTFDVTTGRPFVKPI